MKPNFVIDVDGVMNTGQFLYSEGGKVYKIFGPHDAEGLKKIRDLVNIHFVSADKRGFAITEKRIRDMGYLVDHVFEEDRFEFVKNKFGFENTIFMGDGISDAKLIEHCKFGIAPANARPEAKEAADFVTPSKAAEGAVCDSSLEIMRRFFSDHNYKVVIPAAGAGSRMAGFSEQFNKVLIPVKGKPVIGHIIEKFPESVEIVIAVGYKKEGVVEYLRNAYPERKLTFVDVGKFEGSGSGPGYSLLQCKEHLLCPFIQFAGDTLIHENVPKPDSNWFGLAAVPNTERFCSAKVENGKVVRIDDKIRVEGNLAFIGLAGVKDYEIFWDKLAENKQLIGGEIQLSNGFISLVDKEMEAKTFTWFDTGTPEAYSYTLKNYPHGPGYSG